MPFSWAASGHGGKRAHNIINSLYLTPEKLEQLVKERYERYEQVKANEQMAEEYLTEDADIVLVAGGYFLFEFILYGAGAAASIPANLIQGVSGLILSLLLYPVLACVPDVKRLLAANH